MQHAFPSHAVPTVDFEELSRIKRLRSLLALFALYAVALMAVLCISDGADIGCILAGIAGHVVYAAHKTITAWRDAAWLDNARARTPGRLAAS